MNAKTKQAHGKTYKICGAKTRSGNPCKKPAGWGTDHVGDGRCKLHGGASTGPPKRNKNAEKHGLFSKHLPKEALDIVEDIKNKKGIDILWDNIMIQYAAILRSQKIMWVEDKNDITEMTKTDGLQSTTYEIQTAWDKQASFLKAQSRAMGMLSSMINKYEDLVKSDLATEEQKLRIEKLKVEVEAIKKGDSNNKDGIEALAKAISDSAALLNKDKED